MRKKSDHFKHDVACLILQAGFFVICVFFLFRGEFAREMRLTGWFNFVAVGAWFGLALLGFAFTRGRFQHFLTIIFIMVNAFLVPHCIHGTGSSAQVAAMVGVCYVIAVIVMASNDVAIAAFMVALMFAYHFHKTVAGLEAQHGAGEYLGIGISYLGLVAVALGWRVVITRLVRLAKGKAMPGQVSEEDYSELEEENFKLRGRIAQHILRMNKLTGYEPSLGNKQ